MKRYRALVVEDEPHARSELRTLVEGLERLEWTGEAKSGAEAVEMIDEHVPEVVFLDVQMPGLSGIDVLERCSVSPEVIFTTAHSKHAVRAFELGASDYLLKPFSQERFLEAVTRTLDRLDVRRREQEDRVQEIRLDGVPARRVFVRDRGKTVGVDAAGILRLEADGDYVQIHTSERTYLAYSRLGDLHERLDPARFMRVHRSHVVNLTAVESLEPVSGGRMRLKLRDGSSVVSSRRRTDAVKGLVL